MPGFVVSVKFDGLPVVTEFNGGKGKVISREFLACGFGEGTGEFVVIKGGLPCPFFGIHQNEFAGSAAQGVPVPKFAVIGEPMRGNNGFIHALRRAASTPAAPALLRAGMRFICEGSERDGNRQNESKFEHWFRYSSHKDFKTAWL
ncbi:MAG TPA: hypothetical protein VN048_16095 [Verrucomicrobiae bacterium]|nr:hypothetical protein [Verrucomicrobiae bacterium]